MKNAIVLGASPNPERYSFLAVTRLSKAGYHVFPVGMKKGEIAGISIQSGWPEVSEIDLISVYLNESNQAQYEDLIFHSGTKKVVFNPGAENPDFSARLKNAGIDCEEACTLVMLSTGLL